MKYLIYLLPLLLLCSNVDAQSKKKEKKRKSNKTELSNQHLKLNFGILADYEYKGLGYLSQEVGFFWRKDNRITGGDFCFGGTQKYGNLSNEDYSLWSRRFIQFELHQTYQLLGSDKAFLYAGPYIGLGALGRRAYSTVASVYNTKEGGFNIGLGGRLDFIYYAKENLGFIISAKYNLIDLSYERYAIENPLLPADEQVDRRFDADLDRGYVSFHIGFIKRYYK